MRPGLLPQSAFGDVHGRLRDGARLTQHPDLDEACPQVVGVVELDRRHPQVPGRRAVGRAVVHEDRRSGVHLIAVEQQPVQAGIGLGQPLAARHHDRLQPPQDAEAALGDRERLVRPVGQTEQPYAGSGQLGDDRRGARHGAGQGAVEVAPVGGDRLGVLGPGVGHLGLAVGEPSTGVVAPVPGREVDVAHQPLRRVGVGLGAEGPDGIPGQHDATQIEDRRAPGHAGPLRRVATQLAISRPPATPDFSGWNWVDHRGPCSTAATNRSPPCSAQVTSRPSTSASSRTP